MLPSDIENPVRIVTLIHALTLDEGDAVTICHDNPDFGGPNCVIATARRFGEERLFHGDSVLQCLEAAMIYRQGGGK